MVPMMSRTLRSVTLVAGLAMAALPAWGQTYPSSPVHLIVAYAAGGTGDVVARIVAPKLSTALGQSVIVENRAGASGAIGARRVAVANPDRPTLLWADRGSGDQPALAQGPQLRSGQGSATGCLAGRRPARAGRSRQGAVFDHG